MWVPSRSQQFASLLQKYGSTVAASFAGHTHADDFRLIGGTPTARAFVIIDPPVSPIYRQNPAFRVFTFTGSGGLADQSTYYLTNLKTATSKNPGIWTREYRFDRQWHSHQVDFASLEAAYRRITSDPATRARWLAFYNVSSSAASDPASGVPALYCAIDSLDAASYQSCYCPAH
jgi:hypothetical protein